jgi:hypothetical protein
LSVRRVFPESPLGMRLAAPAALKSEGTDGLLQENG